MATTKEKDAIELIPVMVPRNLLEAVYGFIASQTAAPRPDGTGEDLYRGWTADLIIEAYRATSPRMRVLLDVLAERPDTKIRQSDFKTALGEEQEVVNGVLGSFGRLTSQRFAQRLPNGESTWPFAAVKDIRDSSWYYTMNRAVAEVIRSIDR